MGLKVNNDGISISNSYLNDPSTDEILAVDNPSFSQPAWAFSDMSGSVATWGIYTGNTTTPWNLAHYEFDSFGVSELFYDQMPTEQFLPVVWNGTIRNEGDTSTFTIAGSTYDPSLKRYIMSESGATNGYAYNEPSNYSNRFNWFVGETARSIFGDNNLANASDEALLFGTTALSAGLVFGGYYALGAVGIVGTGGSLSVGSSLYGGGTFLSYVSAGFNGARALLSPSQAAYRDLGLDLAGIGVLRYANAAAGLSRTFWMGTDVGLNAYQGAAGFADAYRSFGQRDYLSGSLSAVSGLFGVGSAYIGARTLRSAMMADPTMNPLNYRMSIKTTFFTLGGSVPLRYVGTNNFSRSVDFTPSTGRTYKVFQRNDINWDQTRTSGSRDFIGKTNSEAAKVGLRPQLPDGSFATLHHSQQSAIGPWFETSTRYHNIAHAKKAPLHPFKGEQHPYYPLGRGAGSLRDEFQRIESPEYWTWREANR